ncbi:hypothetical protein SKAU_G00292940 [Synaphobranchus kaupii]|uniref:Phosphatidylinositol transfer protein N-terminal domain-containing protein n=1 Tax=Synaphobranchus kaupii TaxID=118154 RepID=A0A9Q1IMJ6_SYNKA|nr:hypothetical protein SKAU_G00292940 [Synaphobranchus kaupii]
MGDLCPLTSPGLWDRDKRHSGGYAPLGTWSEHFAGHICFWEGQCVHKPCKSVQVVWPFCTFRTRFQTTPEGPSAVDQPDPPSPAMLVKEYRICMPLTVEEYRIGQLYTICKHSHEVSDKGEGVEVVRNETHTDPVHGQGQLTEKRVHLSSKLPGWARAVVPRIFLHHRKVLELLSLHSNRVHSKSLLADKQRAMDSQRCRIKALQTPNMVACGCEVDAEYRRRSPCSFLPKFAIHIETKYEDNCGINENIFNGDKNEIDQEVDFLDIAFDDVTERHYRPSEDPRRFSSVKTGRGPLQEGWRENNRPVMCSYKQVAVQFEVWGLQTRVEQFVHKVIREVLLVGHRQAFAWVDEWYGMTLEDVRNVPAQHGTDVLIDAVKEFRGTIQRVRRHGTPRIVIQETSRVTIGNAPTTPVNPPPPPPPPPQPIPHNYLTTMPAPVSVLGCHALPK